MRESRRLTIRRLRESRSTSGPAASPTTTDGRNVTMKSALTHHGECVRAVTAAVRATVAIQVPRPEPSVARKRSRKLDARRSSPNWRRSGDVDGTMVAKRRRIRPFATPARAPIRRGRAPSGVPTETRIAVGRAEAARAAGRSHLRAAAARRARSRLPRSRRRRSCRPTGRARGRARAGSPRAARAPRR